VDALDLPSWLIVPEPIGVVEVVVLHGEKAP
jgi:hypothetical protein